MIDFKFISALEGGSILTGYVPNPDSSKSGVTCATGFDLGCRTLGDLVGMDLPPGLITKLAPYLGAKKYAAVAVLKERPLRITPGESKLIDAASHKSATAAIQRAYDKASKTRFADLPEAARTVIASVAFQYGTNLAKATPKFWAAVTKKNWALAVKILEDFGDDYPTRRRKEAALLKECLS